MRLKRLVLHGYKTFASKSEFVFDEGITAIVGPNGSGKSNIADAVRWVLGEQSYSTLRGRRTEDMIFGGSQSRPRAGMAQAILTLDNSEGWLPIDYTEVEIGRRAYRSGENEYILNGQKVRLKDVVDLLATSGLAQRTYTIIGQGLVDQALSLRAEERRALFEEAAGINHYKTRRAETLRRLQETQTNLQRVHDILSEIRPRLTSLKRQATRAQNYEQLKADLHYLLRIWYGYKWEQAKVELRQVRRAAAAVEARWRRSRQKLKVQQENADDWRRRSHRLQQQTAETQEERDQVRDQLEAARREAAVLVERRDALQRRLAEIEQELPFLEQQHGQATSELAAATAELESARHNLAQSQAQLEDFNNIFDNQQAEINRWQEARRQAEQRRQSTLTQLAQAEGQLNSLRERLSERQAESTRRDEMELAQLEAEIERLAADHSAAQEAAGELRRQRSEIQEQRQAQLRELKQRRRDQDDQERQLNRQRHEMARLEARVDLLDQMRHKEAPISSEVSALGSLATLITIPDPYQHALETALQARLGTLVLDDDANLWRVVEEQHLTSRKSAGQRTDVQEQAAALAALALDSIQSLPPPATPEDAAVIGWASDLVSYEPRIKPVVELLLGRILLVNESRTAYRLAQTLPAGSLTVTPDGFLAHAGGLVEIGSREGQNGILAREQAWRQARKKLDRMRAEVAQAEATAAGQQAALAKAQDEADRWQSEEQKLGLLDQETRQRLSQAQRDLDRVRQQHASLHQQQQTLTQELDQLRQRIGQTEHRIAGYRESLAQLEESINIAAVNLAALPVVEAQQQRQAIQQSITSAQTVVAGRQAVVDSRRATLNQVEGQLKRLHGRQTLLRQQQEELQRAQQESRHQHLQEHLNKLDERLAPLKARLAESRQEVARLEEATAAIHKQAHDDETHYTQAKITLSQQSNRIEGLQERIRADLGLVALRYDDDQTGPTPLPIGGVQELPQVEELPADIEETIHSYRGQIQRLGAINLDAPDEYEETQARYDFLTQQIEDLNQTEAQLRQVIGELDELTSRAFAGTVEKVNNVFGNIFTQLFGGGTARLLLTDPDDLTISGVEIIARLPNRREQGLALLSGGERSLTAVALVFSLLKVAPTPFCILDEVDAALDEANINRFRDLLRELSLNTQFIVITHNRGTVQAAQTLYGISMGSDSASQAISIRPEEYVKEIGD